jgi:hypothetical protein
VTSGRVGLAVDVGTSEISVEGFAARETYTPVVKEALRRYRTPHPIRVTAWSPKGSGRGGGDAMARSAALLQELEVGTCRLAGHLPALEDAAVLWQAGQHQPDRVAAAVVAFDVLDHAIVDPIRIVSPIDVARRNRAGQLEGSARVDAPTARQWPSMTGGVVPIPHTRGRDGTAEPAARAQPCGTSVP